MAEEQGAVPDWRSTIGKTDPPDWRETIGKTDVPDWRSTIGKSEQTVERVQERTTEMLQEEVAKWQKERENEIQKAGQKIDEKADPSLARIGAGLLAEITIAEASKIAGTSIGASIGVSGGPIAPGTVPAGAVIGYIGGALSGGFTGNIAAQKLEKQPEISYGRATASALLNLIPGGIGKISKGPKWLQRLSGVTARHPVALTSAIGAASAPASIAIERAVEGEKPMTKEELLLYSGIGAAMGAGIGKGAEYSNKILNRFAGKNPIEIDLKVRRGDPDAVNYVDAFRGANKNDLATVDDMKAYVNELGAIAKARVAPSTVLGRDISEEAKLAANRVTAGRQTGSILNKKITDHIKLSDDPIITEEFVHDYLMSPSGPVPREIAPIVGDLDLARKTIREYQQELVNNHYSGQRALPDGTLKTIEDSINRGDYLTQEYQFFLNKNYTPTKKQTNALLARLQDDGMSLKEAEEYIANLNSKKASNADDLESFIASQNAGILKERNQLSDELRDYLGEVTTPGERIEGTLSKLSRLVSYDTSDQNIKNMLVDTGIAKIGGQGVAGDEYTKLTLRRGDATVLGQTPDAPVNQLYVPKSVQVALNSLYAKGADNLTSDVTENIFRDAFDAGISLSKAAKVLGQPVSYLIQLYGNLSTIVGSGMNPFRGVLKGSKYGAAQFDALAKRMSAKSISEIKELVELGMLNDGVTASDIRSGIESGMIGRKAQKLINPLGKAYSIFDTSMRITAFENNAGFIQKAAPQSVATDSGIKAVKKYASRITNFTYPNYDYLNKALRTLSKKGALGQFAAYSLELARTQFNQGRLIKSMLDGSLAKELSSELGPVDQTAIRNEGLKRLASMAGMYGATIGGISYFNKRLSGYSPEQEAAMRESVLPEWDSDKPLVFKKGKDGKIYYMNSSYLVPQAQMASAFMSGLRGDNPVDGIQNSLRTAWKEIGGEGNFVMNSLIPAIKNYNPKTGDPISTKAGVLDNVLDRTEWFAKETFTPGAALEYDRATSKVKPQPLQQTALRLLGIRVNDTTIDDGARFKLKKVKDNLTTLSNNYSYQKYKKQGQGLDVEYQRINKDYRDNSALLAKHAKNYRTLGFSEDKVLQLMRDNGIGPAKALAAIDGEVLDLPKTPRKSITEMYETLPGKNQKEKMQAINMLAKDDPFLAKSLVSKMREEEKIKILKISERDKAVMSLGADDGTRAGYIFSQMQKSQDPDGVYKNYLKKGLIDAQVNQQLQSLKNAK